MVRRLSVGALCVLVVFVVSSALLPVGAASGDKQLSRVKGDVGYQKSEAAPFQPVVASLDLPDDAFAVTHANAQALLRLRDSSEVAIGQNTVVQVGAFNPAENGTGTSIVLKSGALHFTIRRPQGGRSNYTFSTPTSQIAVRGTEAYMVTGPNGTQIACVVCQPGDVTIRIGTQTISLVSGQAVTIQGTSFLNSTFSITQNSLVNNPAFNQFGGSNLFASNGALLDPTGAFTGATAIGATTGIIPLVVGGAVAGGIIVASNTGKTTSATNAPTATPSPTPTPTPQPTNSPTFTPTATPSSSPTFAPTPTPTPSPTPTSVPTATPTATPTPTPTPVPFGTLNVSPTDLSFNGPSPNTFNVSQTGPSGMITISQPNCNNDGAAASLSPTSVAITPNAGFTTITVNASAAPTQSPAPTHACQVTVTGANGQTATVYLDIYTVLISGHRRGH
ncbi:MAG: FecR domain-containing protein [Candidatus Eremiobacteraeota bacterium]|nr:FecR domain-containing protein [Candidatus Eremiobacteraeota bacterium]